MQHILSSILEFVTSIYTFNELEMMDEDETGLPEIKVW